MTAVLDRPEKDCFCGHPRQWHNERPAKVVGNTVTREAYTFCLEWGCKCRRFEEVKA